MSLFVLKIYSFLPVTEIFRQKKAPYIQKTIYKKAASLIHFRGKRSRFSGWIYVSNFLFIDLL